MLGALALLLASACPSLGAAGSLPSAGPALRGDVDGDGRRDRVTIVYAPRAPVSCAFLVLARTGGGDRAVRLDMSGQKSSRLPARDQVRWYSEPSLMALAAVDRQAGLEILVRLWRGASRAGGALLTVRGSRLTPMRLGRLGGWNWGGTVMAQSYVDCVHGRATGYVAISGEQAVREGTTWTTTRWRTLFRARGTTFRVVRTRTRRGLRPGQAWRTDIPEVRGGEPFRRCTVVSAR
jgi:hypothetical protein